LRVLLLVMDPVQSHLAAGVWRLKMEWELKRRKGLKLCHRM
jgi:hypothetical protein